MAESAFGVDHGDVSKAAQFPRARWAGKAYSKAKGKLTRATEAEISVKNVGHQTGRGTAAAGDKIAGAGIGMMNHPNKTGAAVVLAGAGGAGYGGKKLYDHQNGNGKKSKVPKAM